MFASIDMARRIDAAESRMSAEIARVVAKRRPTAGAFVEELGGGVAAFAGADSPVNKMIGVGFGGVCDPARLSDVEERFAALGARLQAEVSTLADPAFHAQLSQRGYVLQGFENVLGLSLADGAAIDERAASVENVTDSDVPSWGTMLTDGFERADEQGVAGDQVPPRDVVEQVIGDMIAVPNLRRYVIRVNGQMASGASMRVDDRVAQLTGSATLVEHRRQGFQTTLIRARLAEARTAGCDVAVVTTAPGSKSQQNVQKLGFSLLYSRALLVKSAP